MGEHQMTESEMQGFLARLRDRLDATDHALDTSPLWLFIAKNIAATLSGVQTGELGPDEVDAMYRVVMDYDHLRGCRPTCEEPAADIPPP
jgi:hypothetical protein